MPLDTLVQQLIQRHTSAVQLHMIVHKILLHHYPLLPLLLYKPIAFSYRVRLLARNKSGVNYTEFVESTWIFYQERCISNVDYGNDKCCNRPHAALQCMANANVNPSRLTFTFNGY